MRNTTNAVGWNTTAVAVWLCLGASWTAFGQERGIINKRTSPHSRLQSDEREDPITRAEHSTFLRLLGETIEAATR